MPMPAWDSIFFFVLAESYLRVEAEYIFCKFYRFQGGYIKCMLYIYI